MNSSYTPQDFIEYLLRKWEGGYQAWEKDSGNWLDSPRELIGTSHGITAKALQRWLGTRPTVKDMRELSYEEAGKIVLSQYYYSGGIVRLPWVRPTAVILGHGLLGGVHNSIRMLQRMIMVKPDGVAGPVTAKAFRKWYGLFDEPGTALDLIAYERIAFFREITRRRPEKFSGFLKGWTNRANHFRGGGEWEQTLPPSFGFQE